jgi:hypothetical protein
MEWTVEFGLHTIFYGLNGCKFSLQVRQNERVTRAVMKIVKKKRESGFAPRILAADGFHRRIGLTRGFEVRTSSSHCSASRERGRDGFALTFLVCAASWCQLHSVGPRGQVVSYHG